MFLLPLSKPSIVSESGSIAGLLKSVPPFPPSFFKLEDLVLKAGPLLELEVVAVELLELDR